LRALIDGGVLHLDVGSSHPDAAVGIKGSAVRRLKLRELGLKRCKTVWSLSTVKKFKVILRVYSSTKGPKRANQWYFQLFLRVS